MIPDSGSSVTALGGRPSLIAQGGAFPDPYTPYLISGSASGIKLEDVNKQRLRRAKVLACTRKLLAREGFKNLCVQRVAQESELTVQTIHNNFGARHELLATAINEHTLSMDRCAFDASPGAVTFLVLAEQYHRCAIETPEFLREMVLSAFSPKWPIMDLLQPYSTRNKANLFRSMQNDNLLRGFVDPEMLAFQVTRINTICVYDWADHQDSEQLLRQLVSGVGLLLLGALRPSSVAEVEQVLGRVLAG